MKFKVPYTNFPISFEKLEVEILDSVKRVMSEGNFILRGDVNQFEENIASFLKVRYCVGVNSGTDALYLALKALNLKEEDEVITVSHTFVATIAAIVHGGAKPVLVDIGDDFNIDANVIERAITKNTKAICPVHMGGRVSRMDIIESLARKYNLKIVEDAAQALGAKFKGKSAGTFGDFGCFSMHPMKVLGSAGDAGALVSSSKDYAEQIKLLRNHGQKAGEDLALFGFSSRLDNLQAAILNTKFKHLSHWIGRRRTLASIYHGGLINQKSVMLPPPPENETDDYYDIFSSYVIRVEERDVLNSHLRNRGIESFIHWPKPLHHHAKLNLQHFKLPKTEEISLQAISLPIDPELTSDQINFIINSINTFYEN